MLQVIIYCSFLRRFNQFFRWRKTAAWKHALWILIFLRKNTPNCNAARNSRVRKILDDQQQQIQYLMKPPLKYVHIVLQSSIEVVTIQNRIVQAGDKKCIM